ncbi:hypothetical protein C0993_012368, partial [Termitomyces sp. T159_Od127]
FQLIAGDYFLVNEEGAMIAEKATNLIGWILNHGLVHSIFDAVQSANSGKVLAFLIANITRWSTHFIAFDCLQDLKTSLQLAVFTWRNDIIAAQVGAKKNQKKKRKLSDDATQNCDMIEDGGFWRGLKDVIDDLEPICLGLNMNQTDLMRPDQVLLSFAGIFLYFQKHMKELVADGMTKRIEKRWKALDQPMFVLALILNPFEGVSCFGPKAGTYRRVCSQPPKVPWTDVKEEIYQEVKLQKEKEVSEAFFSYLSGRGPFEDWEKNKKTFLQINVSVQMEIKKQNSQITGK